MEAREVLSQLRGSDINAYDAFVAQLAAVGTATYLPQNDDELWEYILSEYGFAIPREAICHDHVSPFQAIADVYFSRILDMVLIGPRGGGKTLALAIIDHLLVAHFGIEIANVGAIEEQAKKCYSYFEKFCLLPQFRNMLVKPPMLSKTYLKNGGFLEIMPGTMNRVNSPHPNRAHLDEIELMDPKIIEEAKSMPQRQKGRPPATIWTSSRKKAFGPMEDLLLKAAETGMPVYKYCAFEIIENCPPTRHREGEGCKTCPLFTICKEKTRDEFGKEVYKEGPGRASRAHGWLSIDDLIQKFMSMDKGVFKAQWLSEKPETFGLAFPMFERSRHVIKYKYDPVYPVVAGLDFGFTNPSVALYVQVLPGDILVVFAEDYRPNRTAEMFAESIKEEPWFLATRWRVADAAGRGDRETLIRHGVSNEASRKEGTPEEKSSRISSVNIIRYLLDPMGREPLLYISTECKNLIREIERYHHPDQRLNQNIDEIPAKIDDHAVDALRYIVTRMYRGVIVV
jgi:hypothetical protein